VTLSQSHVGGGTTFHGAIFHRFALAICLLFMLTWLGILTTPVILAFTVWNSFHMYLVSAILCSYAGLLLGGEALRGFVIVNAWGKGLLKAPALGSRRPHLLIVVFIVTLEIGLPFGLGILVSGSPVPPAMALPGLLLVASLSAVVPFLDRPFWRGFPGSWIRYFLGAVYSLIMFPGYLCAQGVLFALCTAIFLVATLLKLVRLGTDPQFFSSFRAASALSLCYLHWLFFPYFPRPGDFPVPPVSLAPVPRLVTAFKISTYIALCWLVPIVDTSTDIVYMLSLLAVEFSCFQNDPRIDYDAEARELTIWKVLSVISCVIGGIVTIVHYVGHITRFRGKEGWLPFYPTLVEASSEVAGDNFDLHPSTVWSTGAKFVGSFGEDLLQYIISCATLGYMGGFTDVWILNVISSSLSITYFWILMAYKFVYGRAFAGPTQVWLLGNLFVFFAMGIIAIPTTTQLTPHFTCQNRPHELFSDQTYPDLAACDFLNLYCLAEPFDYGNIQWLALNFDWVVNQTDVTTLNFVNMVDLKGELTVTGATQLQEATFTALVVVDSWEAGFLRFAHNPALERVAFPLLEAAGRHMIYLQNNTDLAEVILPLTTTLEGVEVSGSQAITELVLPSATTVRQITVSEDLALTSVSLPLVVNITYMKFFANPALKTISLPSLVQLQAGDIRSNIDLVSLDFPSLRVLFSEYESYGFMTIYDNANLTTVSFGALVQMESKNTVQFDRMPLLTTIDCPMLSSSYRERFVGFTGAISFKDGPVTYPLP